LKKVFIFIIFVSHLSDFWAGRPDLLRAPLIDDERRQGRLSQNLLLNWVPQLGGVSDFNVKL
jgi:hypothetical protein